MNIHQTIINGFQLGDSLQVFYSIKKDDKWQNRTDYVRGDERFLRSWVAHLVSPVVDDFLLHIAITHKSFPEYIQLINKELNGAIQHVLLTFQPEIPVGQQRTFLEIPKTFKYGPFASRLYPGNWQLIKKQDGIFFSNGRDWHPIWRNAEFAQTDYVTPKGIQNVSE